MIIKIWDWLFTRKTWTILDKEFLIDSKGIKIGWAITVYDQFGNIKKKKVKF